MCRKLSSSVQVLDSSQLEVHYQSVITVVITVAVLPPELRLPAIHNSDDSAHNYGNYHDDDHRGNDDVYHSLDDESGHLDDCTSHYLSALLGGATVTSFC